MKASLKITLNMFKSGMTKKELDKILKLSAESKSGASRNVYIFKDYVIKVPKEKLINKNYTRRQIKKVENFFFFEYPAMQNLLEAHTWFLLKKIKSPLLEYLCPVSKLFYLDDGTPIIIMRRAEGELPNSQCVQPFKKTVKRHFEDCHLGNIKIYNGKFVLIDYGLGMIDGFPK